jgi:hypothetical protein
MEIRFVAMCSFVNIETLLHKEFVGMCMTYLYTKFQISNLNVINYRYQTENCTQTLCSNKYVLRFKTTKYVYLFKVEYFSVIYHHT